MLKLSRFLQVTVLPLSNVIQLGNFENMHNPLPFMGRDLVSMTCLYLFTKLINNIIMCQCLNQAKTPLNS